MIGPVNEAAQVLEKVAARDLTARMLGNYAGDLAKIKNSLNLAVENLETAMGQVGEATQQVASASGQISSGSQSLAQGANEQASSLEEVSASLEEMSSMTRQNADNALAAKNLAGEADGNAKTGTEAMARMSRSINRIKESSDQTAKIVKTIDEIAMQTNLLALNAAVEAARAGEAGRGFAVVAEEVRNLAQRSAQAAKNTADMIGESVKNAEEGVKISDEVSVSFEKIAQSSKKVNDLIAEIAAASKEQSTGIKEVNDAVGQMDKVTQQNAANAEESASASEELSSQAQELQAMVAQFRISGGTTRPKTIAHAKRPALPPPSSHHKAPGPKSAKLVSSDEMIPMDDDALREF
ncbi:MAG: methyl-accepting chemotaxis protein [Fibrobacterota bacterium]